ncbi:hypothetical protein HZB06_00780, partial [Candidatus Wolfebacteria bacterium]|nr:hypothetical protein [Candidatus Wolfebacteria bacterium]
VATQQFVDITDIKDGTVFLKSGGLRRVLIVSGINFDLKSEEEQNLILHSFQNFLNTLDFSIQFAVHSRKMNIDGYLEKLKERQTKEDNGLLKNQIGEYLEFVRSFVEMNAVMAKTFFAVVPYDPIQIPKGGANIINTLKFWEKTKKNNEKEKENEDAAKKISQMNQRADIVVDGLNQIGLRTVALNDEELTELFYNLYNPETTEKKDLKIAHGEN